MSVVTINKCKCSHEFQDETYGKGNRLFNECKEGKEIRCTVCGISKSTGRDVKK